MIFTRAKKNPKFTKDYLTRKKDDLCDEYHIFASNVYFTKAMPVGMGNTRYCLGESKYGQYIDEISIGIKGISRLENLPSDQFTTILVALHHEFRHVEQYQNMRLNCNPYYGLMLNSAMADMVTVSGNNNLYYKENYPCLLQETDAIYWSLQQAYIDLGGLTDNEQAEELLLRFVNRQSGLREWPLDKNMYTSLDDVFLDLEHAMRNSLISSKHVSPNALQSSMLQRFMKAQPATKSVLYDLNQGYRGDMQDMYLAACYCDSMGDKGFMSPTNGHQSIFFNIHDMNFDSQICGRAWQQARNYERYPLDMDLVWDHRFEDMDEERYEQIFGHPPNMIPKSRPVPEIRGMEDMLSHDFSLGS